MLGLEYIDNFEDFADCILLPRLFYSCLHVIIHLEYNDLLGDLIYYTLYLPMYHSYWENIVTQ